LQTELEIGLLLPCNVIVYEVEEGATVVSIVDPLSMLGIVEGEALKSVANEANARLTRVIDSLAG